VVEKLSFFDARAAAARALRDTSLPRREGIQNHRKLLGAYWALDTGQKLAEERIKSLEGRVRFMSLLRETLAATLERGEPLPSGPAPAVGVERAQSAPTRGPETPRHGRTRE
jgi:hypothetical protein